MKKKKRKLNVKRIAILIIVLIAIAVALALIFGKPKQKKPKEEKKVVDKLEKYGYVLEEDQTKYYNELFQSLKEELNKEEVNEETYATLVAQLFTSDFFTLSNKTTKADIGGVQYVLESYQDDFVKYARDSIYHHVESDIYGDRKQELPTVTSVSVDSITQVSHSYLEEEDEEAYEINVTISYEKDLGYQTKAKLYLVHSDIKLEVVKMEEV